MATPAMQVTNQAIQPGTLIAPWSIKFLTKALTTGTAIDVHTGYTAQFNVFYLNPNPILDVGTDMTSAVTVTFDTTGVTIAGNSTFASLVKSLTTTFVLLLSNDAGTTQVPCAKGSIVLPNQ